jgi:hypothetical protein
LGEQLAGCRKTEKVGFQIGSLSQYPNTNPFSADCDGLKISLFSRVIESDLVTAPLAIQAKFVLSSPMFSKAGDFANSVPVCKTLQTNAKFGGLN